MHVVVVGSGVAGAATAFALARAGATVTIVDAGHPGQATAAGAGILQPWSSRTDGPVYDLYAAGAAYYPTLLEHLAEAGVADIGYRRSGSLVVDADEAELDAVGARVRGRTATGHRRHRGRAAPAVRPARSNGSARPPHGSCSHH